MRAFIAKEESVSAEEEQSGEMIEVEDVGSIVPSMCPSIDGIFDCLTSADVHSCEDCDCILFSLVSIVFDLFICFEKIFP